MRGTDLKLVDILRHQMVPALTENELIRVRIRGAGTLPHNGHC
jgi:hypothetical protein